MRVQSRAWGAVAILGAVLGLLLAIASPASAVTDAYVRLAHLSPDTPNVDVYVNSVADPSSSFVVPGVGYGAVSPYKSLPSGSYVVSMRASGAAKDSPPVISTTIDAQAGQAYTVAGTGLSASLGLTVLTDQLGLPPAGKAAVRCINGAVSAPSVDLGQSGKEPWATGVKFASTTAYTDVPLGTWMLRVTAAGKPPVDLPVTLDANSTYSVVLLDKGGSFTANLVRDSAGSSVTPVGGVETGFGGTAPADPTLTLFAYGVAALALGGAAGLAMVAGLRRARSR